MDPSIELEIDIALRGSHYVATCSRFPGVVGAGPTEEAATEALVASIVHRFETNESSVTSRQETLELPRPHKGSLKILSILLTSAFVIAITGLAWILTRQHAHVPEHVVDSIEKAGTQSQPSAAPDALVTIKSEIQNPPETEQGQITAEPPPLIEIEHLKHLLPPVPDYDALFENAVRCDVPAIAKLFGDSKKGILNAQVRWARLLEVWGFHRESRAWARRLSEASSEVNADFLTNLALLCLKLESLHDLAFNSFDLSRGKVRRDPHQIRCVKLLHEKANAGSIPACIGLSEFYRKAAESSFITSVEERQKFIRNADTWQDVGLSKFLDLDKADVLPISSLRKILSIIPFPSSLNIDPSALLDHKDYTVHSKAYNALKQTEKISLPVSAANEPLSFYDATIEEIKNWSEQLMGSVESCVELRPMKNQIMAGLLSVCAEVIAVKLRTSSIDMTADGKLFNELKESDMNFILDFLEKSKNLGHAEVIANHWYHFVCESGSPSEKALRLLTESAEAGDLSAQLHLAGEINARIVRQAEANDPAKIPRGVFFSTDPAIKKLRSYKHKWILRAAKQGHYESQVELRTSSAWEIELSEGAALAQSYLWFLISMCNHEPLDNDFFYHDRRANENDRISLVGYAARLSKEFNINLQKVEEAALKFEPRPEVTVIEPDLPEQSPGSGTGFFVGPNLIVTNAHVVGSCRKVQVYPQTDHSQSGIVVHINEEYDIALVLLDGFRTEEWLPISGPKGVKPSSEVFTIGFPNPEIQGIEPKYTDGKISSLSGIADDPRFYQITIPVQPGNSGGPLINAVGEVVGIVSARLGDIATFRDTGALPQNVNYAVKIQYLLPLLHDLKIELPHSAQAEDLVEKSRKSVVRVVSGDS